MWFLEYEEDMGGRVHEECDFVKRGDVGPVRLGWLGKGE